MIDMVHLQILTLSLLKHSDLVRLWLLVPHTPQS
jgi:hypothetical protein